MPCKKLGEIIKKLRVCEGESQEALAEELGVSRSKVKHWEAGTREIKAEDIILIAQHYGVSADYILGLTEAKTSNAEVRGICNYTGLSEETVEALHDYRHLSHYITAAIFVMISNVIQMFKEEKKAT